MFAALGPCWDRQTDRQTPYHFIDPAPHTMWEVPIKLRLNILLVTHQHSDIAGRRTLITIKYTFSKITKKSNGLFYTISYVDLTIMPKLRSTYDGRLISLVLPEGHKAFLGYNLLAKS